MKAVAGIAGSAGILVVGKPVKLKKCKHCGEMFKPSQTTQRVCSMGCAIASVSVSKRKEVQRATRKKKKAYNDDSRSYQLKKTQDIFNAFIRERDKADPCISCGRFHNGQWHGGHYRTTAAAPQLRFNQFNDNRQCMPCNVHKSGNITEYRINLVNKFGAEKVEWLEGNHEPKKWTLDEIKAIGVFYKTMLKGIKKGAAAGEEG